jgi:hypothetical protein
VAGFACGAVTVGAGAVTAGAVFSAGLAVSDALAGTGFAAAEFDSAVV